MQDRSVARVKEAAGPSQGGPDPLGALLGVPVTSSVLSPGSTEQGRGSVRTCRACGVTAARTGDTRLPTGDELQ